MLKTFPAGAGQQVRSQLNIDLRVLAASVRQRTGIKCMTIGKPLLASDKITQVKIQKDL